MKRFALIGAAGYIAPRHMMAMRETNNTLVAAFDPNDSVGVIDSHFPEANFFTEFERFDRHIHKLQRKGEPIDFMSICSPNYLHDAHIRFALRNHAHAICEKPLVLSPWNIDALEEIEAESGRRLFNILQLRLHPTIKELRRKVSESSNEKILDVDLTYLTSRGHWYHASWKGDVQKSGGIATNIGIHFFDMLAWVFGERKDSVVHFHDSKTAAGFLEYERARVRWFLSIDAANLPPEARDAGKRTYRSIRVEGDELEFSDGFTDLHTASYRDILNGGGFGLADARASIEAVYAIRNDTARGLIGDYHPFCTRLKASV